ncbi:MAG: uracil-DNA glycosylase-like protein, partial [Acidobacteria bacterium]|nr:uracil-DNA glycosylase-like protein [Acidobacteriota bacterium]
MGRFDRFINYLGRIEVSERACNQYSSTLGDIRANAIRRRNLRLYLEQLDAVGARIVLIGEAPSYRGGRLTGIPFVSETVMLRGVETRNGFVLGESHGYRKATEGEKLSTEASATMVWATIREIDPLPLLWNAFPFHPFDAGNAFTNRMPSAAELAMGATLIARLVQLFGFERIVAVGNHADSSLTKLVIPHDKVRHPSMAGKPEFVAGMARISQSVEGMKK